MTPDELPLSAALARAEQQHPVLRAAGYRARVADASVEQADVRPNPTLGVEVENVLGTGAWRGTRGLEATVQASQTFERGGKRERRVTLARHERRAVEHAFAVQRAKVLEATAVAFVEALAAQARVELAGEPVRLARELVAALEQRQAAGAAGPAEVARARASVALAEVERQRAEAGLTAARARLAALWAGRAEDVPPLVGTLGLPATPPDREAWLARLADHPRLARQAALREAAEAAVDLARAGAVPDVTVGGGVRFLREGADVGFVAGLSLPLPIYDRNQGNVRAARAELAAVEEEGQATERELRVEFAAAWQELVSTREAAAALQREAVPAAEQAERLVRGGFAAGETALLDVLEARQLLVAVRREVLDLTAAHLVAHARLEALADLSFPTTTRVLTSR